MVDGTDGSQYVYLRPVILLIVTDRARDFQILEVLNSWEARRGVIPWRSGIWDAGIFMDPTYSMEGVPFIQRGEVER